MQRILVWHPGCFNDRALEGLMRRRFLPILVVGLAGWSLATAGTINIGNGATGSDPTGTGCPPCDPVLVGTGKDISIEVQGSASITNQVLLAILIPNDTTDLFGTTDPLGTITPYPSFSPPSTPGTAGSAGSSAFTGTGFGLGGTASYAGNGFWGDITGSTTKLAAFLDSNFNSSNNMPNFLGFDSGLGLSGVTEFGVYTFAVTTGPLAPNKGNVGLVDIQIPGGLPQGSIAVALDDNLDSTVWTNDAGVNVGSTSPIPEPATMLLMGTALFGLGLGRALRKNRA
jgi:hypothetical protein